MKVQLKGRHVQLVTEIEHDAEGYGLPDTTLLRGRSGRNAGIGASLREVTILKSMVFKLKYLLYFFDNITSFDKPFMYYECHIRI